MQLPLIMPHEKKQKNLHSIFAYSATFGFFAGAALVFLGSLGFMARAAENTSVLSGVSVPQIMKFSPTSGGVGQFITIEGSNFGTQPGEVSFVSKKNGHSTVADTTFGGQCAQLWWRPSYIIIKVPAALAPGSFTLAVKRQADGLLVASSGAFALTSRAPSPGICGVMPDNGMGGVGVEVFGERLGPEKGKLKIGAGEASLEDHAWTDQKVAFQTPASFESGRLVLITKDRDSSNSIPFTFGRCGGDSCGQGSTCCADGACRPNGMCQQKVSLCTYSWNFTTGNKKALGEKCASSAECISHACDTNGTCIRGSKRENDRCTFDAECGHSLQCAQGKCTPVLKRTGTACTGNAECLSNSCVTGACAAGSKSIGQTCGFSEECATSNCANGTCGQSARCLSIVSMLPPPGMVQRNSVFSILFNQLIDQQTVPGQISIEPSVKGRFESQTIGTGDAARSQILFKPSQALNASGKYSLRVGNAIKARWNDSTLASCGAEKSSKVCAGVGVVCTESHAICTAGARCTGADSTCRGTGTVCTGVASRCYEQATCLGSGSSCYGVGTTCLGSGSQCHDGATCEGSGSQCIDKQSVCTAKDSSCKDGASCAYPQTLNSQSCDTSGEVCTTAAAQCTNGAACSGAGSQCGGAGTTCTGSNSTCAGGAQCANPTVCPTGQTRCASGACRDACTITDPPVCAAAQRVCRDSRTDVAFCASNCPGGTLTMCTVESSSEIGRCFDLKDNDCDGRIDSADPDCSGGGSSGGSSGSSGGGGSVGSGSTGSGGSVSGGGSSGGGGQTGGGGTSSGAGSAGGGTSSEITQCQPSAASERLLCSDAKDNDCDGKVDAIDSDCSPLVPLCGNGVLEENEACDDGNPSNIDSCTTLCVGIATKCGNGTRDIGETCDDGDDDTTDECRNDCTAASGWCGNGLKEGAEECDDGNTDNQDTCSNGCTVNQGAVLVPNARCESITAPQTVEVGQNFDAIVKMKNTGTTVWTPSAYQLAAWNPDRNSLWNRPQIPLAQSDSIQPGEVLTLPIQARAPSVALTGTFDFRMETLMPDRQWFGEACAKDIVITLPASIQSTECPEGQTCTTAPMACVGNQPDQMCSQGETCSCSDCSSRDECVSLPISWGPDAKRNSARCEVIAVPAFVQAGSDFSARFRLTNTGESVWNTQNFFLRSDEPQLNTFWGTGKIDLAAMVNAGDIFDLVFAVKAPANQTGMKKFAWQMTEDASTEIKEWFGERCLDVVTIVADPQTQGDDHLASIAVLVNGKDFAADAHDTFTCSSECKDDQVVTKEGNQHLYEVVGKRSDGRISRDIGSISWEVSGVGPTIGSAILSAIADSKVEVAALYPLTGSGSVTVTVVNKDDTLRLTRTISVDTAIPFVVSGRTNRLSLTTSGNGAVTSTPSGIDCGSDCRTFFPSGISVMLRALPAIGHLFAGWGGGCSGSDRSCSLKLDFDHDVSALFVPRTSERFTLRVTVAGSGSGTVGAGTDFSCSMGSCEKTVEQGTEIVLRAAAGDQSVFSQWSESSHLCSGSNPECTLVITRDTTISALFQLPTQDTYRLKITKRGKGKGSVVSAPSAIDCGNTCERIVPKARTYTLRARADQDSRFEGWSGGPCDGSLNPECIVTIGQDTALTATFGTRKVGVIRITSRAANGTVGPENTDDAFMCAKQSGCADDAVLGESDEARGNQHIFSVKVYQDLSVISGDILRLSLPYLNIPAESITAISADALRVKMDEVTFDPSSMPADESAERARRALLTFNLPANVRSALTAPFIRQTMQTLVELSPASITWSLSGSAASLLQKEVDGDIRAVVTALSAKNTVSTLTVRVTGYDGSAGEQSIVISNDQCDYPWSYALDSADLVLRYCRGNGNEQLLSELLSPLTPSTIESPYTTQRIFQFKDALRPSSTFVDPGNSDVIILRVAPNERYLKPDAWYRKKVSATAGFSQATLYGYPAVKDAFGVYIGAFARSSGAGDYKPIIIALSTNTAASQKTSSVFDALLAQSSLTDSSPYHSFGADYTELGKRIRRDHTRLLDLTFMSSLLSEHPASPAIASGSYLPGQTISAWSSWQSALGNELGSALPSDPYYQNGVSQFGAACVESPPGGYNPQTCWDDKRRQFFFPLGVNNALTNTEVHVYSYSISNSQARFCAKLESGRTYEGIASSGIVCLP